MTDPIHPRQRARAKVMAFILAGFCILFFAITIVKMKAGTP